ncbi:MAG: TolC family protein, partial [Gammaproteobacteria bacterium]
EATPADLLRFRSDIAEAEQAVLRAAGELGVARAALYPSLSLTGVLGYSVRISGTSATSAQGLLAAGPVVDIPLFDWGLRKATANGRAAELQAAVLAYRQSVLEGYAEAQSAISEFAAQGKRVAAARAILERRVRESAATERLAMTGHASELDAWTAQSRMLAARVELGNCEEARGKALVAFYKAIGGAPLPDSVAVG